jgi:hypothetical protein
MMPDFRQQDNRLIWGLNQQIVQIEPWGRDSLHMRATTRHPPPPLTSDPIGPLSAGSGTFLREYVSITIHSAG